MMQNLLVVVILRNNNLSHAVMGMEEMDLLRLYES
jgi:hypothetical protein